MQAQTTAQSVGDLAIPAEDFSDTTEARLAPAGFGDPDMDKTVLTERETEPAARRRVP